MLAKLDRFLKDMCCPDEISLEPVFNKRLKVDFMIAIFTAVQLPFQLTRFMKSLKDARVQDNTRLEKYIDV